MGLTLAIWVDDVIAAHGCGLRLKINHNFGNRAQLFHFLRKTSNPLS